MVEHPEQEQPGLKAGASGAIVPGAPVGTVVPEVLSREDPGAFDPEPASEGGPFMRMSAAMLLRCKWLILGVFLLVTAAALPPIWLLVVPTYRAIGMVRVRPVIPKVLFDTKESGLGHRFGLFMNTQVSTIHDPAVLERVLDREEVKRTGWWDRKPRTWRTVLGSPPPSRLDRLQAALTVRQQPGTELINVEMVATEAADARVIVNAVVQEYLAYCEEAKGEQERELFKTLREERTGLEQSIDGLNVEKADFSKELGTDDPDIVRSTLDEQRRELEMERMGLEREHELTLWVLKMRQAAGAEGAEAPDSNLQYAADPEWVRLNDARETARHELKIAQDRYGPAYWRIKVLESNLEHAERRVRQREAQLGPGWVGPHDPAAPSSEESILFLDATTLAALAKKQARELEVLQDQITELEGEQQKKGDLAKKVSSINEKLLRKRKLHTEVYDRLQALEMEQKAPGRISRLGTAVASSQPYRDRRFLLTVMALGAAMMTGLAVAYLRTAVDPKICEVGDLRGTVRVPFLGQLPPLTTTNGSEAGCDARARESMRMVRTALLERLGGTGDRVVLITSSCRRAGKTSVAIGLARSLAHLGKRTLLVEADLRKPSLAERLGLGSGAGLTALLSGSAKDNEVIVRGDVPKLDILLAGEPPAEFDSELLANGMFATCLRRWKKTYDFIVLDSPPVLPVADARILAGQADGTLMVLRSDHCRRTDVIHAYADLSAAGGTLLGTVLVGARHGPGYGYDGDYRAYADSSRALNAKTGADQDA